MSDDKPSGDLLFAFELRNFREGRLLPVVKAEGHDPEVEEFLAYAAPLLATEVYEEVRVRVAAIEQAVRNVPLAQRQAMGPREREQWGRDLVLAFLSGLVGYTTSRGQRAIAEGARYLAAGGAVALAPSAGETGLMLEILRTRPAAFLGATRDYAGLLDLSIENRINQIASGIATEMSGPVLSTSNLIDEITDDNRAVVTALDQWAYRWRNVGAGMISEITGRPLIAFNNPPFGPDIRTSSFCRWAHGRELSSLTVTEQISASGPGGSPKAIRKAWPFVGNFPVGARAKDFHRRYLQMMPGGLGLPPYHFGCRTQVRISR